MATPTPGNWRHVIISWAFALLLVAVVLHIAAGLLRSAVPELIGMAIAAVIVYAALLVHRFRKSRW